MTKKQVIWLLIRLAGLWFLWQSVESGITLIGSYLRATASKHFPRQLWKNLWTTRYKTYELLESLDF